MQALNPASFRQSTLPGQHHEEEIMLRKTGKSAIAAGLLVLSGAALARPPGPPTVSIPVPYPVGPVEATVLPPSEATNNRLIVDVTTRPLIVNLYASTTRVAVKESVRTLPGLPDEHTQTYSFKQAIDLPKPPQ
jgi:hypothetical protein